MRFVGDNQIEISRRKKLLVFVVEEQRLDGSDHNFSVSPVVAIFFEDDGFVIVGEHLVESFVGLVFKLQTIYEEEYAVRDWEWFSDNPSPMRVMGSW